MTQQFTPEQLAVLPHGTRNRFRFFVEMFWSAANPSPFVSGYFVDVLCEHLQAVKAGQIQRLAIAKPIRHGGSMLTSVMFPPWLWTHDPSLRILSGSCNEDLAVRDSRRSRDVITSPLYQDCFGHTFTLAEDQNSKKDYITSAKGNRKAVGADTKFTGQDADVIIVDDWIDIKRAHYEVERKGHLDGFDYLLKRLVVGTGKDRVIVSGHRVHEDDCFNRVWEVFGNDKTWTYLVLPAEAKPYVTNSYYNATGWKDTRAEGELIFPERLDAAHIKSEKKQLRHKYQLLYQQDTTPEQGDRINAQWFKTYTEDATHYLCVTEHGTKRLPKKDAWRIATSDAAISTTKDADWTVCQIWDIVGDFAILVDQLRMKLDGTRIVPTLAEFYKQHSPQFLLVEEEFIGRFLIDQLREQGITVRRFNSKHHGEKETRFIAAEIRLEAGKVWFPGDRDWVSELQAELLAFPNGKYDDQCDCLSQLAITMTRYRGEATEELTPEQAEQKKKKAETDRFNQILNSGLPW